MKVIIVEDTVYTVPDKEYKKLSAMYQAIKDEKSDYEKMDMEENLNLYLDDAVVNYKIVGRVMFDFRR